MEMNDFDSNLIEPNKDQVLSEFRAEKEAKNLAFAKAKSAYKAPAWIVAIIIPALLMLSLLGRIGYAGLGGIILLLILIPSSIIAIILLRFIITGPFFKTILDTKTSSVLRKAVIYIGVISSIGLLYLMWNNAFEPHSAVKKMVDEIHEIEIYFEANREAFETQRMEAGSANTFYVNYPQKNSDLLQVWFIYDAKKPIETGYEGTHRYTYELGGHWYIEIILLSAN